MIIPLVLGYVVGAVAMYSLLVKFAPVVEEDKVAIATASGETVYLFDEQRKAA